MTHHHADQPPHRFLAYTSELPPKDAVREVAKHLLNQYLGTNLSRSKLAKLRAKTVECFQLDANGNKKTWTSVPLTYAAFERSLRQGTFPFRDFNLFDPLCHWLDSTITCAPPHLVGSDGKALRFAIPTHLGRNFPIVPVLDREGVALNSPQLGVQKRIRTYRTALIEGSDQYFTEDYVHTLRLLVAECVTLIDTTLHQVYYRAKFDPPPGWQFKEEILGLPHATRLSDKLGWIARITGRDLNSHGDSIAFRRIRSLRNHLQHFDPPCFAFTLEDLAGWLNDVIGVARVARNIRLATNASLSVPLIELLLSRPVRFVPPDPSARRLSQQDSVGYRSSCWPNSEVDATRSARENDSLNAHDRRSRNQTSRVQLLPVPGVRRPSNRTPAAWSVIPSSPPSERRIGETLIAFSNAARQKGARPLR